MQQAALKARMQALQNSLEPEEEVFVTSELSENKLFETGVTFDIISFD